MVCRPFVEKPGPEQAEGLARLIATRYGVDELPALPPPTESEIELIAANRSVAEEVLSMIAHNRQWNRKYNIIHALIKNPRTNVGMAVRLVSRLSIRDLRNLSRDRNVSEAVRNTAARLYRIKSI